MILGRATVTGDIQLRTVDFRYDPTVGSGVKSASTDWSFLNPKLGISIPVSGALSAYASVGVSSREPTRSDMFAGADEVDSVTAKSVFPLTRVHPERAFDVEAGTQWRSGSVSAQANLFLMQFHNEIAPIGAINEIGYELRKNVDRSVRRGLEADATWQVNSMLTAIANVSITDARIDAYTDDASGVTYSDVTPLMTPKFVSSHGIRSALASWLSLDVDGRYVSRMILTNTNDPRFTVPESWYADLGATVHAANQSVLIQLRNVFDRRVYTGGYPGAVPGSSDPNAMEPYYYPLAPRNVSVNVRLSF
jgi:iron complex outermembrane receptor protein